MPTVPMVELRARELPAAVTNRHAMAARAITVPAFPRHAYVNRLRPLREWSTLNGQACSNTLDSLHDESQIVTHELYGGIVLIGQRKLGIEHAAVCAKCVDPVFAKGTNN